MRRNPALQRLSFRLPLRIACRHFLWQSGQRRARNPTNSPLFQNFRPHLFVKTNGRKIPIKNRPFESSAAILNGDFGQIAKHSFAVTPPPKRLSHIQVFQIQTRPRLKGRKAEEKDGHSNRFLAALRQNCMSVRRRSKERFPHLERRRRHFVQQIFIRGQLPNHLPERGNILRRSRANAEGRSGTCVHHKKRKLPAAVIRRYSPGNSICLAAACSEGKV